MAREIKVGGVLKASILKNSLNAILDRRAHQQDNIQQHWFGECAAFLEHWATLREARTAPTLVSFVENLTDRFKSRTYFVEFTDRGAEIRFQGDELATRWQADLTGQDIHQAFSHYFTARSIANMRDVVAVPCGYLARASVVTPAKRIVTSDVIRLPLSTASGSAPVFACYSVQDPNPAPEDAVVNFFRTHRSDWLDIGAGLPTLPPYEISA